MAGKEITLSMLLKAQDQASATVTKAMGAAASATQKVVTANDALVNSENKVAKAYQSIASAGQKVATASTQLANAQQKVSTTSDQAVAAIERYQKMEQDATVSTEQLSKAALVAESAMMRVDTAENAAAEAALKVQSANLNLSSAYDNLTTASNAADAAEQRIADAELAVQVAAQKLIDAEGTLAAVQASTADATDQATEAEDALAAAHTRAAEATQEAEMGLGELGSSLLDVASKVSMVVIGMQAFVDSAKGIVSAMIAPNASMEQMTIGMTTLLHSESAAKTMMDQLWNFAAKTPFHFPGIDEAAQKLIAFGFNAKDVIPDLTAIGDSLSALGRTSDANLSGIVEIFGKIQAQGKLMARDMMMLSNYGVPAWKMLADQLHRTVPQVQEMVRKGLIPANQGIEMLRRGMEQTFGGGMLKQAYSFNGLMTTFSDNVQAAWRSFTGSLFEAAKESLVELGNLVSAKKFQDLAKAIGKELSPAIKGIANDIKEVVKKITEWVSKKQNIDDFKKHIKDLSEIVKTLWENFKKVAEKVGDAKKAYDSIAVPAQKFLDTIDTTNKGLQGTKDKINAVGDALAWLMPILGRGAAALNIFGQVGWWAINQLIQVLKDFGIAWNLIAGPLHLPTINVGGMQTGSYTEQTGVRSFSYVPHGATTKHAASGGSGSSSDTSGGGGTGTGTTSKSKAKTPSPSAYSAQDIKDIEANARKMGLKFNDVLFQTMTASQKTKYLDKLVGDNRKKLVELLKGTHSGFADYIQWELDQAKKTKTAATHTAKAKTGKHALSIAGSTGTVSGTASAVSQSASGFTVQNFITNNITNNINGASDTKSLYNMIKKEMDKDIKRSGLYSSMTSGGKSSAK